MFGNLHFTSIASAQSPPTIKQNLPFSGTYPAKFSIYSATMAFVLRRPFVLPNTIKQIPKAHFTPTRAIHTSPKASFTSKPASPLSSLAKARNALRRSYTQPSAYARPDTGSLASKLLYGGAIFGGTILATNILFNRETREDGGMPPFERAYLNETFMHTGLGVGMIGVAAKALHSSGWSFRLMSMNPW